MKKKYIFVLIIILPSLILLAGGDGVPQYDPWGVWNKHPVTVNDRIRTFSTGKYYEYPFGLYIVRHLNEAVASSLVFPAIAITGEYHKIEKYESIEGGLIFHLIGDGFNHNSGRPQFQDNTRIQVKMHFINDNEVYFEYVSLYDENGFHLSYFPEENVIYKRLRAD